MSKKSKGERWMDAAKKADAARDVVTAAAAQLAAAFGELLGVQQEYAEWRDNLPESLAEGATAEKLGAVCDDIDIESLADDADAVLESWADASEAIDLALDADLPRGFGRD